MITSIQEHYKVHLNFDGAIVLLEELLNLLNEYLEIADLPVDSWLGVNTIHIVAIDDSLRIEDAIFFKIEGLARLVQAIVL